MSNWLTAGYTLCPITVALIVTACGPAPNTEMISSGDTMGTQFSVTVQLPASGTSSRQATAVPAVDVGKVFDSVSKMFSTYDPDSELARFNAFESTAWFPVTHAFCTDLEDALTISRLTEGAFDATVGRLVNLWGFGPEGARNAPPTAAEISVARESTGYAKLHTRCEDPSIRKDHPGLHLDMSGYAKGLAIDQVADRLDRQGYTDYLVELGGEVRARGHNAARQAWRIAIERPDDTQRTAQLALRVSNAAVATSGDYRNYFQHAGKRYSHTIDAGSGKPVVHDTASVTVVAEHAAIADALATALLVMGHSSGLEFAVTNEIAAYFLVRDGDSLRAHSTPEFSVYIEP